VSGGQNESKDCGAPAEVMFPTANVVYFDTNAWNRLLDHPERERILTLLQQANVSVLASIFSGVEVANTRDLERRRALCGLMWAVTRGFPLLGHPMEVAVPIGRAILDDEVDYLFPESDSAARLLRFLGNLDDEDLRLECLDWKRREEEKFAAFFEQLKPPQPNPSVSFLTREVIESDAFLETLLLFEPAREAGLTLEEMRRICNAPHDSIWTAVRAMLAYWIQDALRHAGQKRPNAFDLWQAVYLGLSINAFVTDDTPLLDAARKINKFLKVQRLILTFDGFLSRLA
jgi:hypothetical protein